MNNEKPKVLELVEKQTHKSYGEQKGGRSRIAVGASAEGASGKPHRVYLIHGGTVVKEWDVNVYLERSLLDLQRT